MFLPNFLRFTLALALLLLPVGGAGAQDSPPRVMITDFHAVPDGQTVNTRAIQTLIDQFAAAGGGTVVVPAGVFVSGALFFKPGVTLHLEKGAVLQASTDMKNFPGQRTRIEGHFEENFNPALINANGCDGLRITGEGTLDGAGRPIWDLFWKLRSAVKDQWNFRNLSVPRARLALIENSKGVVIDGITFKDSQFWNLHLYRCRDVLVQNVSIRVPDDYKQAPSSDGIDVDSSQDVTIKSCTFSVTDDCVALKGSKGPAAQEDPASPPVERVRVIDCTFRRGHAGVTLGSEAAIVRDLVVENCRMTAAMPLFLCKLRPDTPQIYENVTIRDVAVDNAGATILQIAPWVQYVDLKGQEPPKSTVSGITISGIKGRSQVLASVAPNPGQTAIRDITLRDIDLSVTEEKSKIIGVENLRFENVTLNGKPAGVPAGE